MVIKTRSEGDSGLNLYSNSNNRTQELLLELQGKEGSVRYRQMSKGDGQVGMILRCHKNPIRSASWAFEEHDDSDDTEKRCIEILNQWFFKKSNIHFDTLLGQILTFLEYGFSCFETSYQLFDYEGVRYFVPNLEQRVQTSIEDIFPDKMIIRQSTISKGVVEIPFEYLVFFILDQQGEDMRGEAIIRNAYPAWKDKKVYEQWLGIGIQRSAGGVPSMKIPKGVEVDSAEYTAVKSLLEGLTIHENAYMIYPEGYEFNMIESKFNAEQIQKAIDSKNTEMAMSVLTQFILLGQTGGGGSYALSEDQSDFFFSGLEYIVGIVEKSFHKQTIAPFIRINFGDSIDPDRINLKCSNLNKNVGEELATILTSLKSTGFVKPIVDDEVFLRKCLKMPELSEDEITKRQEALDNPPIFQNPFNNFNQNGQGDGHNHDQNGQDNNGDNGDQGKKDNNLKLSEKALARAKRRQEYISRTEIETVDFMKANLLFIKDKLMADIESTLNRGVVEIQGLKKIDVGYSKYTENLQRKLAGIADEAWNNSKSEVKLNNVKFTEPKDLENKNLKAFVLNQASSVAEQQATNMKNRAILTASNGPLKGYTIGQTLSNVERVIQDYIDSGAIQTSGSLVVVGTTNFGEMQFYKEIEDQLWGYRFVSVDDDRTTEICKWYNGKLYSVNSPELSMVTPPLHSNCRSYLDPVYKSEKNPGQITNEIAPPSIRKQQNIL